MLMELQFDVSGINIWYIDRGLFNMDETITIEVPTSRTSVIALDSIKKKNVTAHGKKIGTVIDKAGKTVRN